MKVLWLCNIIVPQICGKLGIESDNGGGWLTQLADILDEQNDIELGICAPYTQESKLTKLVWGHGGYFWGVQKKIRNSCRYDRSLEVLFKGIIEEFKPDIVHIFGTEFPHTLAMVRAFNKPNRTVIHIQGLVSVCAHHYCAYLPCSVTKKRTFRDFIKQDNIVQQKRKFELRGEFEIEAIRRVEHVMGRTDWDQACCEAINPNVKYHYVQEMMREEFYEGQWDYEVCEKRSIFMSQGGYPIKGLHLAIKAIYILRKKYPDIRLYVAGDDIFDYHRMKKIRTTYYAKYIVELIKEMQLERQVVFLGSLNAEKMRERFLLSNVFISPSAIENSPNSIGEAMLLGVPIVASDVGGVSSLLKHRENGFLYPGDEPEMLAFYIEQMLNDVGLSKNISRNEIKYARYLYDTDKIKNQLMQAYQKIIQW